MPTVRHKTHDIEQHAVVPLDGDPTYFYRACYICLKCMGVIPLLHTPPRHTVRIIKIGLSNYDICWTPTTTAALRIVEKRKHTCKLHGKL